jgi:polyhydroxybutyrate depolymerase
VSVFAAVGHWIADRIDFRKGLVMRRSVFVVAVCLWFLNFAEPVSFVQAADLVDREWTVDGVKRQALIQMPPTSSEPSPVVFGFHGHGGTMRNAARSFRMHELWPNAIVVYMQGLNTPGQLTDAEGKKPGWQRASGDQNDRDLKFFDAVLKTIRAEHKVDDNRIYAMGHSNGGGFTYLLWAERADIFAAMAPSGAAALKIRNTLPPKPVMHIAGDNDPLVKFAWQSSMIDAVRKSNQCGDGSKWESSCTMYSSKIGTPVVTLITSGGHKFPSEAPALIVKFFKMHSKIPDPVR